MRNWSSRRRFGRISASRNFLPRWRNMRGAIAGSAGFDQKQKIVNFFGPCAPKTKMRSMSPVRLGPVMNEIMLG